MTAAAWVTLGAAVAAAFVALGTLRQKHRADNRKEWWARFQYALDATYSGDAGRTDDGWQILNELVRSRLATATEAGLVGMIYEKIALWNNRQQGAGASGSEETS